MEWKKLLSQGRLAPEEDKPEVYKDYYISPFETDYENVVSSAAFRRLQDKTQVFPLAKSDFVRTRLTHSIEVSTIAKQLGIMCFQNTSQYQHSPLDPDEEGNKELRAERVDDIEAILSCAGLLHDLGNPPFGHAGEAIIGEWFENNLKNYPECSILTEQMRSDLCHFEGNAQSLRILLKARYHSEINLPYSIISALVKYPTSSLEIDKSLIIRHKMGYYHAEATTFLQIARDVGTINEAGKVVRNPLAYLVEAADDIAYKTADLEDAVKSELVTAEELLDYFKSSYKEFSRKKEYSKYIGFTRKIIDKLDELNSKEKDKAKVMSQWGSDLRLWLMYVAYWRFSKSYDEILNGTYQHDLFYDNNHSLTVKLLKQAMSEFVFGSRIIVEPEISAQSIISFLLDKFVPAVIHMGDDEKMTTQDRKVITLISPNYLMDYEKEIEYDKITDKAEKLYRRLMIATDFVSGMTDGYAKTLYRKMIGLE